MPTDHNDGAQVQRDVSVLADLPSQLKDEKSRQLDALAKRYDESVRMVDAVRNDLRTAQEAIGLLLVFNKLPALDSLISMGEQAIATPQPACRVRHPGDSSRFENKMTMRDIYREESAWRERSETFLRSLPDPPFLASFMSSLERMPVEPGETFLSSEHKTMHHRMQHQLGLLRSLKSSGDRLLAEAAPKLSASKGDGQ